MSITAIETALVTHLQNMSGVTALAYEGHEHEPNLSTPYTYVTFLPAPTPENAQELGTGAPIRENGSFIMNPHYPVAHATLGGGYGLRLMVATLMTRFKWRQDLVAGSAPNDFKVRLQSVSRGQMITEDGWSSCPVTVSWFATRPAE